MPRIDFAKVEDTQKFGPLPEGEYRCCIVDIEETVTQHGDEMWKMTLEVTTTDHLGRRIFDNLVFSDRAMPRVKHFCSELGLDVSGEIDLEPKMVKGRECLVTVVVEDYKDETGVTKKRNRVPFTGYGAVDYIRDDDTTKGSGEDVPF